MAAPYLINAFIAGELAPALAARVDLPAYYQGAAELYNTFVDFRGGAVNRAGTEFMGKDDSPVLGYGVRPADFYPRLIPFIYDEEQSLVLVFSDLKVRFMSRGGFVVEDPKNITGITKANPGVVTAVAHGYVNDELVYHNEIGGMTELNGRYFKIANKTTDTYQLRDIFTGAIVNTSGMGTYTSGGKAYRVYTITSPYALADVWTLKFTQSRDVMTLVSPLYPPYHLTRVTNTSWSFALIDFKSKTPAPTGLATNASMTGTGTEYSYIVTATDKDTAEESEGSTAKTDSYGYWTAEDSIRVTWNAVSNAEFYTIYRASVAKGRAVPGAAIYGQVGQARGTTYNDVFGAPNWALTPPTDRDVFGAAAEYPSCVTYVQQRAAFAGSIKFPFRIWMTPVGAFDSMNRSLPSRDNDSLQFELASQRADPINDLQAMPAGVLCCTTGGIYHAYGGGEGEPITPSNINVDLVSSIGASFLTPIVIELNVLYAQYKGGIIRNLIYNFNAAIYDSFDLTLLSIHLFAGRVIIHWAYSNEPWKIIWAVRDDGRLLSLTFLPEQKIWAWALHETQGFVKDVCVIPEGHEDAVYLVVERPDLGYMSLERMAARPITGIDRHFLTNIEDCWFVDCGEVANINWVEVPLKVNAASGTTTAVAQSGTPFGAGDVGKVIHGGGGIMTVTGFTSSTQITVSITRPIANKFPDGKPRIFAPGEWSLDAKFSTFQGLHHCEGKSVYGLADGEVVGPLTVTNGVVTLPQAVSRLILGPFLYESRIKTLPLEFQGAETVQTLRKNIPAVTARVVNSKGIEIGPDFSLMQPWQGEFFGTLPSGLHTGDERIIIDGGWSEFGQICIRQQQPLPMQILGLIPDIDIGDTPVPKDMYVPGG